MQTSEQVLWNVLEQVMVIQIICSFVVKLNRFFNTDTNQSHSKIPSYIFQNVQNMQSDLT